MVWKGSRGRSRASLSRRGEERQNSGPDHLPTDEWLLIVTLGVSIVTFASGHANVVQGCVHLILFAPYILLMFQG